ncbi:MAG: class I SAM-dependent rRNA methyltransferase [Candidatus Binatia bacterium]
MITIRLKSGREGPVRAGHPWIFSGAIDAIQGQDSAGTLARVMTAEGRVLGIGYHNPRCSIAVRMLTREDRPIDASFIGQRLEFAFALRRALLPPDTTGYRLVNGEGDFLPGFVVDVYGQFIVCQCLTAGAEALKPLLIAGLVSLLSPQGIYEKSEGTVRQEEGLPNATGLLWGVEPPPFMEIQENTCQFLVDPRGGQKTGFFLDQRDNRTLVRDLAQGKHVLNGFAYTGGFGVFAAKGGARHVVSVESSDAALHLARRNWDINHIAEGQGTFVQADMFTYLRETRQAFDLIILDPPPFARRRQDVPAGLKGYKEINLQAFRLLAPGGQLLTFSCSQHILTQDFLQTTLFAAADARRQVQLLKHLGPAVDHPLNLVHVEGAYLKGLWLRVGD